MRRRFASAARQAFRTSRDTSLAPLLLDTNIRDEARTMLAEIYHWFTEGLDIAAKTSSSRG
jgi:hypothetical protein